MVKPFYYVVYKLLNIQAKCPCSVSTHDFLMGTKLLATPFTLPVIGSIVNDEKLIKVTMVNERDSCRITNINMCIGIFPILRWIVAFCNNILSWNKHLYTQMNSTCTRTYTYECIHSCTHTYDIMCYIMCYSSSQPICLVWWQTKNNISVLSAVTGTIWV